jgi:hypothetical protein
MNWPLVVGAVCTIAVGYMFPLKTYKVKQSKTPTIPTTEYADKHITDYMQSKMYKLTIVAGDEAGGVLDRSSFLFH